jgi:hypothetical protein
MMVWVPVGCSTESVLNLSTSSPSSLNVVWMVALYSPRPEEDVGFIGVDVDVWGTLDDVKEDVWAAPVLGCVVLVLGVIPEVVGVCVVAGNGGDLTLPSSSLLIGTDKVLPEGMFIGILLVNGEAAVPANPLHVGLVVVAAVALFCAVDIDAVHPIVLALGDSEATMSTKVEGRVSNDPSAIIAVIAGTGVDVVVSLQSCLRFCASRCCSWR